MFDLGGVFEATLPDPLAQGVNVGQEAGFGAGKHGGFFLPAQSAAAKHEAAIRVIKIGDGFDFNGGSLIATGHQLKAVCGKCLGMAGAAAPGDVDHVAHSAFFEQGDVRLGCETGVGFFLVDEVW